MNMKLHRWINSLLTGLLLTVVSTGGWFAYGKYSELDIEHKNATEMSQLASDEGFKRCVYKDTRKFDTIGFGHLVKPDEKFTCITPQEAMGLLREDYDKARKSVEKRYPWADDEVKLVLTNMTYQLGEVGLSKFKQTLKLLEEQDYENAAMEMLDSSWYKQTPKRAMRLSIRILALEG